jgi:hypothetical protein
MNNQRKELISTETRKPLRREIKIYIFNMVSLRCLSGIQVKIRSLDMSLEFEEDNFVVRSLENNI